MTPSSRFIPLAAGLATVTASMLLMPADASAQRRAVRRSEVRPVVHVARPYRQTYYMPVYYRPYYYAPYMGLGYFGGYYSGWYGYGWRPHPVYWQPYPYGYYRNYLSEARIEVEPREAEVFIDGYYVGVVDDFDGWAQRLRVEPGERVLEIYEEGFQTYRQNVLFRPGATLHIEHVLQPLAPGEPQEPRPTPSRATVQRPPSSGTYAPPPSRGPSPPPRAAEPSSPPPASVDSANYGAVAIRVQPRDAELFVNGERWSAPQSGDLTIQLAEGTHRVEIRRQGFRTYSAEIRVRPGETTTLNVSLSRQ